MSLKAEILVPLRYNDGTVIEQQKFKTLFEDLAKQFGAVSENNHTINGYWIDDKKNAYLDTNKVYWVIVADTEQNRKYFIKLQNKLKRLFKQKSILIYFSEVKTL